MARIETLCLTKWEDVKQVGPEHYKVFIDLSDSAMEILVKFIIRDGANYINKNIFTRRWQSDEELYDYVKMFLELIADGKVAVRSDGKLTFWKPIGKPPTEAMRVKIEKKIESFNPVIKNVLLDLIIDQGKI